RLRTVARGLVRMARGLSEMRRRAARFPLTHTASDAQEMGVAGQECVTGIRYRPRSGHRTDGDTRITTDRRDRERGAAAAARSRTARLPSTGHERTVRRPGGACAVSVETGLRSGPRIF